MIITPDEKKEKILLDALRIAAELHERNEQRGSRSHLGLDRIPDEIRTMLLTLCKNPDKRACLLDYHWTQLTRTIFKTQSSHVHDGEVYAPFIYGLTDAGWKKYKELDQKYPSLEPQPPIVMPVPFTINHDTFQQGSDTTDQQESPQTRANDSKLVSLSQGNAGKK